MAERRAFTKYNMSVRQDGTFDRAKWGQLLAELDQLSDEVTKLKALLSPELKFRYPLPKLEDGLPVPNPADLHLQPGDLVTYRGPVLARADATNTARPATHAVGHVRENIAYLYSKWEYGPIKTMSNRGRDASGVGYLAKNGSVTDVKTDLRTAAGAKVGSYQLRQPVCSILRQSGKPLQEGLVYGTLNISPQAG